MPSKNNPELSPEETRELLVQGDENSLEAIKDLTEALAEHKNNAESFVAITLAERAKIIFKEEEEEDKHGQHD